MRIELKTLIILILTLICISVWVKCFAVELTLGYGQDIPVESWQSDGLECSVSQVEISKQFKSPWYGSVVLDRLRGKLNYPHIVDNKHFSGSVTGLFGGLGILPRVMPEIGNSGVVGHFGAGIRYDIKRVNIGVEWWHMSDPLNHGDKGWNMQLITIGWRF